MAKKTHNIGEYCMGGTIVVEWDKLNLNIKVTNYKKPKEVLAEGKFHFVDKWLAHVWLTEYTTEYYAEKVLKTVYA
jgi:hypothetical protein